MSGDREGGDSKWWDIEPITASRAGSSDQVIDEVLRHVRPQAAEQASSTQRETTARQSVLVVEDDPDLRELFAEALQSDGSFAVTVAADGIDGLRKARAICPDVIITDFSMPAMDGAELTARLAADEATRTTPVVMVSAYADRVPREVRLACAAFMAKPCEPEALMRIVSLVLATRGTPRAD